jgi:hypothetical protein
MQGEPNGGGGVVVVRKPCIHVNRRVSGRRGTKIVVSRPGKYLFRWRIDLTWRTTGKEKYHEIR